MISESRYDAAAAERGDELLQAGDIEKHPAGGYRCLCKSMPLTRRVQSNGAICIGNQCRVCGRFAVVSKRGVDVAALPEYRSNEAWGVLLSALSGRDYLREREAHSAIWWAEYDAYLKTPAWQNRRRRVLDRANGICEACLEAKATQVHHTTYRHAGNEPLWELRAICGSCHEKLTELDRTREST